MTITIIPKPNSSVTGIISATTIPANATSNVTSSVPTSTIDTVTFTTRPRNTTTSAVPTSSLNGTISITIIPGNATTSEVHTHTSAVATPITAANFTGVLRGPASFAELEDDCPHLPVAGDGVELEATLENDDVRQRNGSLSFPIVGSVNFDWNGISPLYLSVSDAAKGSHRIDVSNSTAVTIFDSRNNALRIDLAGIHFATAYCNLTVSYKIENMYEQLAQQSHEMCSLGAKTLQAQARNFVQTLFLRDQCNGPVRESTREYPTLVIAQDRCVNVGVDNRNGTWVFNCPWSGAGSELERCVSSVEGNAIEFLLYDPFNGECADVSSVVTQLEASAGDLFAGNALKEELYHQVGDDAALRGEVDEIVVFYQQLWEMLKSTLSKTRGLNPGRGSNLKQYLDTYNMYRNFAEDACRNVSSSSSPANLTLVAGATVNETVVSFSDIPRLDVPIEVQIQDPGKIACCPNAGMAATNPDTGVCAYPQSALVPNTNCVCGQTAGGTAVAFRYRQCDNFVSQCETDLDCNKSGHAGYLCLIGSCCGKGVCFDPQECSRPHVKLLEGTE